MTRRRPRVTDDEIFAAAQRAMMEQGPQDLTLAHIGAAAGVTSGRLVQRFGSKRAMLLALAERSAGSAAATFSSLRAAHPTALEALRAYASCLAGLAATPDALARNLAYLQIDLTDPEFHRHLVREARATRREIESLVRSAVAEGALRQDVDASRLARIIEAVASGSLMTWACYREGQAKTWILAHLDAALEPFAARPSRRLPTVTGHTKPQSRVVRRTNR